MKKITLLLTMAFLFSGMIFGQEEEEVTPEVEKTSPLENMPSIGVHTGIISYMGDLNGTSENSIYGFGSLAYGFGLEKKLGTNFGISVNGIFGEVSKSQPENGVSLNFSSSVMNFDLNFLLNFGKETSLVSPFFSVGLGYLSFDPKGDLSSNGQLYNHWSDGTIRNISQSTPGADTTSVIVVRDYDYETSLEGDYSKSTFTVPLWLGLKVKLSRKIDVKVAATYIFTFTDYIDNVAGGGNDKLFYTSFGLQYNFVGPDKNDKYRSINFASLFKEDSDNDGVFDNKDMCQGTPENVAVDSHGCPFDMDKDGVPDYKDKEKNTAAGAQVNRHGVTLTDDMIKIQVVKKDSVKTEYKVFKSGAPD